MRIAKVQLRHGIYVHKWARSLCPLSGWACAYGTWHHGGLEDTFSLKQLSYCERLMVEIVNTPCSWDITRCADKSTAEYMKYIYIATPPPTHTHARTRACTHKQMHARTHTSWTSVPSAFLSYLTYVIPSFLHSVATLYLSIAPPCPSISTFFL